MRVPLWSVFTSWTLMWAETWSTWVLGGGFSSRRDWPWTVVSRSRPCQWSSLQSSGSSLFLFLWPLRPLLHFPSSLLFPLLSFFPLVPLPFLPTSFFRSFFALLSCLLRLLFPVLLSLIFALGLPSTPYVLLTYVFPRGRSGPGGSLPCAWSRPRGT